MILFIENSRNANDPIDLQGGPTGSESRLVAASCREMRKLQEVEEVRMAGVSTIMMVTMGPDGKVLPIMYAKLVQFSGH